MKLSCRKILLLASLSFTLNPSLYAEEKNCGTFSYQGIVKIVDKKMNLIINEKTLSEYTFVLTTKQEAELAPYLNKPVQGEVEILKVDSPYVIKDFKIISSDRGTINPLVPTENSYLKPKTQKVCEK